METQKHWVSELDRKRDIERKKAILYMDTLKKYKS